jgi:hypothetical protein
LCSRWRCASITASASALKPRQVINDALIDSAHVGAQMHVTRLRIAVQAHEFAVAVARDIVASHRHARLTND